MAGQQRGLDDTMKFTFHLRAAYFSVHRKNSVEVCRMYSQTSVETKEIAAQKTLEISLLLAPLQ